MEKEFLLAEEINKHYRIYIHTTRHTYYVFRFW